jgi:tetratricopeptide (TPR) repeat protein
LEQTFLSEWRRPIFYVRIINKVINLKEKRMAKKTVFAFILILLICVVSFGQQNIARVKGTVRDQQGNRVPGAKITFVYLKQNIKAEAVTNKKGEYLRAGLHPGIYKITVEAKGYSIWISEGIYIKAGETELGGVPELDFILESLKEATKREEAIKAKKNVAFMKKEYKEANKAYAAKDFDTAIQKYKKILEIDDSQSSVIYNLAMSYINKKMFKEAGEVLKKGVANQPESAEVNFYFAYTLMMANEGKIKENEEREEEAEEAEKRMKEAEEYFQKSLEFGFNDPDALFSMGAVMANNKREGSAIEAFTKAVELKPDFERAFIEMATSHVRLGYYKKAKELFEQYLKEHPEGEYVARAEQMIKALARILNK